MNAARATRHSIALTLAALRVSVAHPAVAIAFYTSSDTKAVINVLRVVSPLTTKLYVGASVLQLSRRTLGLIKAFVREMPTDTETVVRVGRHLRGRHLFRGGRLLFIFTFLSVQVAKRESNQGTHIHNL